MLIGIDVGGTYTDGALFSEGSVLHSVKRLTDESDLEGTLLSVLDELVSHGHTQRIKRVVMSTTLVTNLLATGRGERTALILLPGNGLPFSSYTISPDTHFLKGGIDFRGREIAKPDREEIEGVVQKIENEGICRVAVVGKFSNRNDRHERLIRDIIRARCPHMDVCTGNESSGRLNFPRRAVTCYFTAMTMNEWNRFADGIETAVRARVPDSELHILKADGGTMTLEASRTRPCETAFSGPAASAMGTVAITGESLNSVSLDIGGTTTDLCLLVDGHPLYASQGALICGHLSHINSFAVKSVPLGGDSRIFADSGRLSVGQMRIGPAACFGGETPTVTDAFNLLLGLGIGNVAASEEKLGTVASVLGRTIESICEEAAGFVVKTLRDSIYSMFGYWENEPAYKVWEVVHRKKFVLHRIVGIGAGAPAIVPSLAKALGVPHFLHRHSPVANAIGAALARPTLAVQVHVDTEQRTYTVSPGGISGQIENHDYQLEDARRLAGRFLKEMSSERGLSSYGDDGQIFFEEQFNMIRGMGRSGKLFNVGIQIAPGFVPGFKGVAE